MANLQINSVHLHQLPQLHKIFPSSTYDAREVYFHEYIYSHARSLTLIVNVARLRPLMVLYMHVVFSETKLRLILSKTGLAGDGGSEEEEEEEEAVEPAIAWLRSAIRKKLAVRPGEKAGGPPSKVEGLRSEAEPPAIGGGEA